LSAAAEARTMSRYYHDDDYDDDDLDLRYRRSPRGPRPHSGAGMVSFAMALVAALGGVIATVLAVVLSMAVPPVADDDPLMIVTVLVFLGSVVASFTGLVVGFVGAFQSDRNPTFGVVGLGVNAVVLLGMIVLIALGILADL
jgi:hypothetical protein